MKEERGGGYGEERSVGEERGAEQEEVGENELDVVGETRPLSSASIIVHGGPIPMFIGQ